MNKNRLILKKFFSLIFQMKRMLKKITYFFRSVLENSLLNSISDRKDIKDISDFIKNKKNDKK